VEGSAAGGAVDVNTRGMWGNTPLISACQYQHTKVALYLCLHGADVNAANERNNTALLYACLEVACAAVAVLCRGSV
jgi:ankyrin repeat protein